MRINPLALFLLVPALCWGGVQRTEFSRPALFSLGVGIFDVLRPERRVIQYQADYKFAACWYGIQPLTSLLVNGQGSVYLCAGACYDIFVGKYLVLTPSFCPGIYFQNGGKNLGYPLEFRSAIALAAELPNKDRIGLQFYHISNASLGHRNPGVESVVLSYSFAIQ